MTEHANFGNLAGLFSLGVSCVFVEGGLISSLPIIDRYERSRLVFIFSQCSTFFKL